MDQRACLGGEFYADDVIRLMVIKLIGYHPVGTTNYTHQITQQSGQ